MTSDDDDVDDDDEDVFYVHVVVEFVFYASKVEIKSMTPILCMYIFKYMLTLCMSIIKLACK